MNYIRYTFFYNNKKFNKVYRSRVRATSFENALAVLKQAAGENIEIIEFEAVKEGALHAW